MKNSIIQWTDYTWNIARGCTKVDEDCKYCYMYRDSLGNTRYDPKQIVRTKTVFDKPLHIKEPSLIFTSSLTDFFHPAIDSYRNEAWEIIKKCPQHIFQILTKRPERILQCLPTDWNGNYKNVWLGTSIGSNESMHRLRDLLYVMPTHYFLSLEPLHGPIDLKIFDFVDIGHRIGDLLDWVIIGGESGNDKGPYKYRPCELEWMEKIVADCKRYNIPVFVKQMGTYLSKRLGMSDRHGTIIEEFPSALQLRQFPKAFYF